jgi:DNA-binding NarL/FixJ family response regulator
VQLAVYVVEDNADIQENLVGALEELTCVKVVGGSASEAGALAWIAANTHWDMLIVDLFLKGGSGMRLVQQVQRARPEQKIIVFSNYVNAGVRKRCAQLGVDAVFDKSTEIDALVDYCAHQCTLLGGQSAPAPLSPSGGPP